MAHGRGFVRLQKSIVTVFLLLWVTELANGQVNTCNGTGCSSCSSYTCCLQVRENAINGSSVGSALIHSPFNNLTGTRFSIDYFGVDEDLGLFNIDNSGMLTVNQSADREDEQHGDCLRIQITAITDETETPAIFAINIVDENDNRPVFSASELQLTVPETTGTDKLICSGDMRSTLRATDADAQNTNNSLIHYRIATGMGSETFSVEDQTQPCISNRVVLDRESQPNYTCTLIVEDQGTVQLTSTATVTVVLLDLNDNSPQFISPPPELMIPENENVGYVVHQFQANDTDLGSNREIWFDICSEGPATALLPFGINTTTGELSLISTLDYEATPSYQVTVCAIDRGDVPMTGETQVTIDVLDRNDPLQLETKFLVEEIEENSPALIMDMVPIVRIRITDFDQEPNTVNTVTLENGQEFFEVQQLPVAFTMIFFVIQTEVIDREMNSTVDIVVRVNGGVDPPFTEYVNHTVNITDVNDNDPELHETQFELVEEDAKGSFVGFLGNAAFDLDQGNNGTVGTYHLLSVISGEQTDLTDAFASVNSEGDLFPNGLLLAPTIDREVVGAFLTCVVQLTDMGEPTRTASRSFTVQILDINDNCPEFQNDNYEFTLMENGQRLELVGRVVATDPDYEENGTVIYDVEPKGNFIIDHNGSIWSNKTFDRETSETYRINITARDDAIQPKRAKNPAKVTIIILDENDNPPMFTETPEPFDIDSNREVGYRIFDFNNIVIDPDAAGPSNTVFFSLSPSEHFSIDITGVLSVTQKLQITEVPFNLTVTAYNDASDTKLQDSITITINVIEAFPILIVGASAGSVLFVLILIVVVSVVMVCLCFKNRRGKFVINNQDSNLNNQIQKPILKTVPAEPTALKGDQRGRVKFSGKVEETHYDYEQAVGDSSVYRKQSTTNFGSGSSDESPATPPRLHHNGNIPIEGINGDIPAHISHFNMHRPRQRSPLVYRPEMTTAVEMHEYSQGSTADDTTGYNSIDGNSEDESTFSDDASNMNTSIPCFQGDEHTAELRYPPQLHTHMHEPPPPHLPNLHVQLPSYHHAQYPSPQEDLTITLQQNGSVSSHSHSNTPTHAPIPSHQMPPTLDAPPRRVQMLGGSRSYPHPLVMPDAYPRGTPDIPRFEAYMPSYQSDYDTSTYASTELDEALGFNMDTEPGFYSLTATDCDEQEDTQL